MDDVVTIIHACLGGQEMETAVAEILTGLAETGGRLPTTWPAALEDVPVTEVTSRDGTVTYDGGIHIGYRAGLGSSVTEVGAALEWRPSD